MNPYRLAPAGFLFHLNSRPVHHQIMRPRHYEQFGWALFKSAVITNFVMKVKVSWLGETKEIKTNSKTVAGILKEMKINPEIVLVSINNEIVPDGSPLKEKDHIEILKVVSGG